MKHQTSSKIRLSALTAAVTCLLYAPGYSLAQDNSVLTGRAAAAGTGASGETVSAAQPARTVAVSGTSRNRNVIPVEKQRRLNNVSLFAGVAYTTMVNNVTTEQYLANRHLASSSTFPLRLLTSLKKNPWRAAPFMPVQDRDLSCYYGIPPYREPLNFDVRTTPVEITANEVTGSIGNLVSYSGDVIITQGDKTVRADEAVYDRANARVSTSGNLIIQGPELTINSTGSLQSDLTTSVSTFTDASFQFNGSVARGRAESITVDNSSRTSEITSLQFSTCPVDNTSWYFQSDKVKLAQDESFGSAWGNVLYIKDVPVMYLPYLNFPITSKRKSGLLYPSFSISSDNGFDYQQPIYLNIAPNYDFTLTPRLMTKRGVLLSSEFRYMPVEDSWGSFTLDYLPQDNSWELSDNFDNDYRYFLRWDHTSWFMDRDLQLSIDYQKVRNQDYDYINDIGPSGTTVTDDHLKQSLKLSYNRPEFVINTEVRNYQRLLPESLIHYRPFAMLPDLQAEYTDTVGALTYDLSGSLTKFASTSDVENSGRFEAYRYHFEPDFNYQFFNQRGTSLTARAKGFFTHYSQDSLDNMPDYYRHELGFNTLDKEVTRALYMVQLRAKTTLERKVIDLRHTQTLEPEIQYQFIPYTDQNNIALYDTTNRMSDYYSNFSSSHYTGKDRIADINSITFGLSSRLLDAHDREMMRFGVSQTYSFVPTRVTLNPNDPANLYPRSPLSFFFDANPVPGMTTHASATYTNETNELAAWTGMMRYKDENGLLMQVSYRFARDANRSFANETIDLGQLGIVTGLPLSDRFSMTFATYHDLAQDTSIDTKVALKYEDCCWSMAFIYENYNSCDWDSLEEQRDHRVGVQFEFKGVGAISVTGDSSDDFTNTRLLNSFDPTNLNQ
ncbi:LPS assembly protein LptD [Anaerobiospirillum sp. NML120449]|uniref:LPS-assembly protein LptD n=1 Tax=Anaerobiospirillum sp. NML120449 TaxID=2932817 RepID=UPI001FF1304D|nr:LPS assembly protein LptD [Anaerobiospirillum sp. NML120449]